MSEVSCQSIRGPMDRFRTVCQEAIDLDLTLGDHPEIDINDAVEAANKIQEDGVFIGMPVSMSGRTRVPLIQEDSVEARGFSDIVAQHEGIYLGLQVVQSDTVVGGELIGLSRLRVAHMLQMEGIQYIDDDHTLYEQTPRELFMVDGAELVPNSVFDVHSFEYINNDAAAQRICHMIDGAAMNTEESELRAERIIHILKSHLGTIVQMPDRQKNILSYVNSLGVFDNLQALGRFCIADYTDPDGMRVYTTQRKKKEMVFQEIIGVDIAPKMNIVGQTAMAGKRDTVYLLGEHENFGEVAIGTKNVVLVA